MAAHLIGSSRKGLKVSRFVIASVAFFATRHSQAESMRRAAYILSTILALIYCLAGCASPPTGTASSDNSPFKQQPTPNVFRESTPTPLPTIDPRTDRSEEAIRLNIENANKAITYEHLKKNAERYKSEPWTFTGKIFQIQESDGKTFALVSLDGWGNKMMAVSADFTTELVDKDQAFIVGQLAGNYTYESIAGWNITIPAIDARAILKPSEAKRLKAGIKITKK